MITVGLVALGVFILLGVGLLRPSAQSRWLMRFLGVAGVGCIGAGVVSEEFAPYHAIFGLLIFLFVPFAALVSYPLVPRLVGYLSLVLGLVSLAALAIMVTVGGEVIAPIWMPLGLGGMEDLVVFTELPWLMLFGAALVIGPQSVAETKAPGTDVLAPTQRVRVEPVSGRPAMPPV